MAPVVHFRSVVALAGHFPVLSGVDLDVDAGEVVLLEGPNGAGKTSLLRACAGLLPVTRGTAVVLGHDLTTGGERAVRNDVGLLGHTSALYDDLTVAENIAFALRAAHVEVSAADAAMARVGLDGRLRDVAVARLSAGQRRRTALAVLVARRPRLWLLDEPHAGLDAASRQVLDELITDAVAGGATVLVASHETERARRIAHRTVTIVGGRVSSDVGATRVA
ncbi:MAG TPA: heme ABC exporter ATP-binding protein CcmA [Acidimicrobiales bacterium]|nr:heme ABC exporter ATP-binding protein CcmA [Acidimicrobiales bacterium]